MSQADLKSLSTEALDALFESVLDGTVSAVRRGSTILAELAQRGERRPHMREGAFRWFKEITAGSLSARAAFILGGLESKTRPLVGLPHPAQDSIAAGAPLATVEYGDKGEIVEVEKPLLQMNKQDVTLVFGNGKVRSVAEQTKILRDVPFQAKPVKTGRFFVDLARKTIEIGKTKIEAEELAEPLRALGWKLVRISPKP